MRRIARVPLLALVGLALAACAPTPGPTLGDSPSAPRPTAAPTTPAPTTPAPGDTATPEDDDPAAPVATRILIRTETLSFGDEAGWGIDRFSYLHPHTEAAAKLTAVFGLDPVVETFEGADGGGVAITYSWADGGFVLHALEDGPTPGGGVYALVPSVNGVAIETLHGVRVGTPMAEAHALGDEVAAFGDLEGAHEVWFDSVEAADGTVRAVIAFGAEDGSGAVREIHAPISTGVYG